MSDDKTYPNEKITVKGATLSDDGSLSITYDKWTEKSETERYLSTIDDDCDALVHDDLRKTFKKLVNHMCNLCDLKEMKHVNVQEEPSEKLDNISVSGFKFTNKGGVILTGLKRFGNKILKLSSPETFTDEGRETYPHVEQFATDIADAMFEVEAYIGGKCAAVQMDIGFGEDESEQPVAEELSKKTRRAAKKLKETLDEAGVTMSVSKAS